VNFSGKSQLFNRPVGELEADHEENGVGVFEPRQPIADTDAAPQAPLERALTPEPSQSVEAAEPFVASGPRAREDALNDVAPFIKPDNQSALGRGENIDEAEEEPVFLGITDVEADPEPVRVQDKPIVETLSSRFDREEEDDLDKPAFLRKGHKVERSIVDDGDAR